VPVPVFFLQLVRRILLIRRILCNPDRPGDRQDAKLQVAGPVTRMTAPLSTKRAAPPAVLVHLVFYYRHYEFLHSPIK
jgi:hypothetical protein